MKKSITGFTIVELLIVIVVVAILAAISIAGYSGIRQRADNMAIINAASQTIKSIQAYHAQEGGYPMSGDYVCITTATGCVEASGAVRAANATFDTNIIKAINPPRNVPNSGSNGNGIMYHHSANRQLGTQARPVLLMYYLNGQNQKCGVPDVMTAWGTPGQEAVVSTTGYTAYNSTIGKTVCFVSVPV